MEMTPLQYADFSASLSVEDVESLVPNLIVCKSLRHCEPVQQLTPPEYALVFQTCLFAGKGPHLCYSSHQQCPDVPNEEL